MSEFDDLLNEQAAAPAPRALLNAGAFETRAEVDRLIRELNRPGDHRKVFQFAGRAVVMTRDKSAVLKSGRAGTIEVVRSIPRAANRGLLAGPIEMVSSWEKFDGRSGAMEPRPAPPWAFTTIVDIHGEGLKPLMGVADFPCIMPNGKLLCGYIGYDPESRLFVDCAPINVETSPFESGRDAFKWLDENMLCDFPFATYQDKVRSLAIPLTILSRRTRISGGSPIPFITSPTPNTGKTLLAQCLVEAVTDQQLPVSAWDHDNEAERRKAILSIALENPAAVLFDNINNGWAIGDATLDKYITSDVFSDRLLGKNETAHAPSTALPIFTGNNISAGSVDLFSRSFEIRMQMPAKRIKYKHRNLLAWVRDNRVKIIQSLYAIATEKVRTSFIPESRFPDWAEVVGARVQYAANCKDAFASWVQQDQGNWNEDLEKLCVAMSGMKHGNNNGYGYTPAEMSEHFSIYMADVEPDKTERWMWKDDKLVVHGKIPPKQVNVVLKKYRGHIAGKYRLEIEIKTSRLRSDGRKCIHFRALGVEN